MLEPREAAARASPVAPRASATAAQSALELLRSRRCVVSLDIDCFYAQCEELRRPELRGTPVGVQQKMLVITSNYEARKHGIGKGDSLQAVRHKCPSSEC